MRNEAKSSWPPPAWIDACNVAKRTQLGSGDWPLYPTGAKWRNEPNSGVATTVAVNRGNVAERSQPGFAAGHRPATGAKWRNEPNAVFGGDTWRLQHGQLRCPATRLRNEARNRCARFTNPGEATYDLRPDRPSPARKWRAHGCLLTGLLPCIYNLLSVRWVFVRSQG